MYSMTEGFAYRNSLSTSVAVTGSLALEVIGMSAGHLAMKIFQEWLNGKRNRAYLGLVMVVVLASYVGLGLFELDGNTTGQIMFLIAPLMYITQGVRKVLVKYDLEDTENALRSREVRERTDRANWEAAQEAERIEREIKASEAALAHQAKLAELEEKKRQSELAYQAQLAELENKRKEADTHRQIEAAKLKLQHEQNIAQMSHDEKMAKLAKRGQLAANSPQVAGGNVANYTDWRKVPADEKERLATLSPEGLNRELSHLPDRTRREWVSRLRQVKPQN
jgi:hypothetical protein